MASTLISNHPQSRALEVYISGQTFSKMDEEIRDHVQECESCLRKAALLLRKRLEAKGAMSYQRPTGESLQPVGRF